MSGPYILIVDDDEMLLRALSEALRIRIADVRVDTAASGHAATELVKETDYDAIITDIKMPGMDGLSLLARIRDLRPETPTLLITGHGEHNMAIEAVRKGAYDFIQKPIDRDYFVESLRRAIQMRQLSRQVDEQQRALERYATSLEQMVEERTRELVEANRVKDEFLSIASHELKNPLIGLKLYMQLSSLALERGGVTLPSYWEKMRQSAARLEMLINDLIDAVRMSSGKLTLRMERFDIRTVCEEVAHDLSASMERDIVLELPEQQLEINGDMERMGQVLTNLLINAIHFSPPDQPVSLGAHQVDDEVIIDVTDHGIGIAHEHLLHVFERFYQVQDPMLETRFHVGMGLGLFICREIVDRHGGRIWAESTVGQGSRFFVALRLAPAPGHGQRGRKTGRLKVYHASSDSRDV